MESPRVMLFVGISGLALLAGVICILIAAGTAIADKPFLALTSTYIQVGIAGFLFAIWFAVMALFFQIRDRETNNR